MAGRPHGDPEGRTGSPASADPSATRDGGIGVSHCGVIDLVEFHDFETVNNRLVVVKIRIEEDPAR